MTYEKQGQQKIARNLQDMINRRLGIRDEIPEPSDKPGVDYYNESIRVPGFMRPANNDLTDPTN